MCEYMCVYVCVCVCVCVFSIVQKQLVLGSYINGVEGCMYMYVSTCVCRCVMLVHIYMCVCACVCPDTTTCISSPRWLASPTPLPGSPSSLMSPIAKWSEFGLMVGVSLN